MKPNNECALYDLPPFIVTFKRLCTTVFHLTVNNSVPDCTQKTLNSSNRNKNEPFDHLRGVDPMKTGMKCESIVGQNLAIFEKKQYWSGKLQDSLSDI
jgi:hypothetical protein